MEIEGLLTGILQNSKEIQELGVTTVITLVAVALAAFYAIKVLPEDRKHRRNIDNILAEQVALSRQALDTANVVIQQNTEEFARSRGSHERLGERMGSLEECFVKHDERAIEIAQNVAIMVSK